MRRFYRRCDAIVAPAESTAAILRAQRMNRYISIWTRGIDREQFNPERRSHGVAARHGIADDELVVAFLGRLVLEKGLDVFADAIDAARPSAACKHRVLVIGDGPARAWFEERLPDAIFTGQLAGDDLARALASADVFLNPSITERSATSRWKRWRAGCRSSPPSPPGATNLVRDGVTGMLADAGRYRRHLPMRSQIMPANPALRARHGEAGLAFAEDHGLGRINSRRAARLRTRHRARASGSSGSLGR